MINKKISAIITGALAVMVASTSIIQAGEVYDVVSPQIQYEEQYEEIGTEPEDSLDLSTELNSTEQETERKFLFINMKNCGGTVVLNTEDNGQLKIRLEYEGQKLNVYDKDESLIYSNDASEINNTYMFEEDVGSIISINVESDDGYEITEIQKNDIKENTEDAKYCFNMPILLTDDVNIGVEFKKQDDNTPLEIQDDKDEEDLTMSTIEEDVVIDDDLHLGDLTLKQDNNLCYISAAKIDKKKDGTAPFDTEDGIGNDSSSENNIVRSFDYIDYTIKYTTALKDYGMDGVNEAYVMVEFDLPCDPSVAVYNMETLNWCTDMSMLYIYEDGTSSSEIDENRVIVNQKLTGKRFLVNNEAGNAIPGTGTLSVGLYVKASPNGIVLKPSFKIWMEGNDESEKHEITDETLITASPNYDIVVLRNNSSNILGYYDTVNGEVTQKRINESDIYGRLQGYGIGISLQGDSIAKGMRGIELPHGEITFDLKLSEYKNDEDVSGEEEYSPFFWDYNMNSKPENKKRYGYLNRNMVPLGQQFASGTSWQTKLPFNKNINNDERSRAYCYDGGQMFIEPDSADKNLLHVTLSDYKIDIEKLPDRWWDETTPAIPKNIGYFSVGYVQAICQFPSDTDTIDTIKFDLEASNIHAKSLSNEDITIEKNINNNLSSTIISTYPTGSHSKRNFFENVETWKQLNSTYPAGDAYTQLHSRVMLDSHMTYSGDLYISDTNILQKFDDKVFEFRDDGKSFREYQCTNKESIVGRVNTMFAAKPDKSGWVDDTEMNTAREENLVYFKSIDDLNAAGYRCVGVLYEVRDSMIYPDNGGGGIHFRHIIHIRDDVNPGVVAMSKGDVRSWKTDENVLSWSDVIYDRDENIYGIGNDFWEEDTYIDGYQSPKFKTYTEYEKAIYENGTMIGGHTNGYVGGNSLLIIGNKVSIDINVADETDGVSKSIYDLDIGERTVKFKVQPRCIIDSANSEIWNSEATDNITVFVTLPKGLRFNSNGVSITPYEVIENEDGTTKITWKYNDVKINEGIDEILFSAAIGDEGTIDDVKNNERFNIQASITSSNDMRPISNANMNCSETMISVVKLSSSSVTKKVLEPLVESGQPITYRLRYSNSSTVNADNIKIYDIMPYNDDKRDSHFSGGYSVTNVKLDFTHAEQTLNYASENVALSYTSDENGRTQEAVKDILYGNSDLDFTQLSNDTTENIILWDNLSSYDITSLLLEMPVLIGNEYIDMFVSISPLNDSGDFVCDENGSIQQPGDVYANNFSQYADNQAAIVTSNTVKAKIAKRVISGRIFFDNNQSGIQDDDITLLSDIKVNVLRADASDFDNDKSPVEVIDGISLYDAYDVIGQKINPVITQVDGSYVFDNLESGTYYIVAYGLNEYSATDKDVGEDDNIDSDASQYDNILIIDNIILPKLENIIDDIYESKHNDIGIIKKEPTPPEEDHKGSIKIIKYGNGNEKLPGVTLLCEGKNGYSTSKTTDENGEVVFDELPIDNYSIKETETADGHVLLKDIINTDIPLVLTSDQAANNNVDVSNAVLNEKDGKYYFYDLTYEIHNNTGFDIPESGGTYNIWMWIRMILGFIIVGSMTYLLTAPTGKPVGF